MPETPYTYNVAADFPGGKVNTSTFAVEIAASSIVTAVASLSANGGTVANGVRTGGSITIKFKDALSAADKTTLDGDVAGPAGGLIAAHNNAATADDPQKDEDGVLLIKQQPQKVGLLMCDRDVKLNTCVLGAGAFEDKKVDVSTRLEVGWNEMVAVGVFKADGTPVADQTDADLNGVLSVWDYRAVDQADGTTLIPYDIRGGSLRVDAGIPLSTEAFSHRIYAMAAPDLGQPNYVRLFDGYVGLLAGETLEVFSPSAKHMNPNLAPGASVLRVYIYHPAGAKRSHVLRLVTYRGAGTF